MEIAHRPTILRLLALLALAVSAALLVDGWLPQSRLCGFESDCDLVVHSWLGKPFGVPLSLVGAMVFSGLFGLSLAGSARVRRLFRPLALLAGAGGSTLIGIQLFVLGHACPFCLLIDTAAIALAVLALSGRGDPFPPVAPQQRGAWLAAAALGLVSGILLGAVDGRADSAAAGPVPPQVEALWVPGRVNVVEVYDFQCPHCRKMHPVLQEVLAEQGAVVHHVRVTVPMPSHPQARYASRAYLCAEKQHKGRLMTEGLIALPFFTAEACEEIASLMGLDVAAYRACVADPATDERLNADLAWVKEACAEGLPVIWIEDQRFAGLHPPSTLRAALGRARRRLEANGIGPDRP